VGRREEEIEKIANDVCSQYFCTGLFEQGRKILQKLYLKEYYTLDDMVTKRHILYRLIVAERLSDKGTEEAVCKYVKQLKKDMDNTPNYKEKYKGHYIDMMSYYSDCEFIEMSNEELMNYYDYSFNYYKQLYEIDNSVTIYIRMVNMQFNISKLQKNFEIILNIIENLHNIPDEKATSTLKQMLCDIENMDKQLYNESLKIIKIASKHCV